MIQTELSLVTVVLCGFGFWIFGMFGVILFRGRAWEKRNRRSEIMLPRIREKLIDYLAGSEDRTELRALAQSDRADLATAVTSFEGTVAGSARDRLCELALDLALVHDWCVEAHTKNPIERRRAIARLAFMCSYEPCRRVSGDMLLHALNDPDDEVKLFASRALAQWGSTEEIERVFENAVSADLLVRILLTEELRRHAIVLCERAIPKVLETENLDLVLPMLEMVMAWERALPMPGIPQLLEAEDRRVRTLALRLAALTPDTPEIQKGILEAIGDPDPEIAAYGAWTAGRLRMESALPGLARCLRIGNPDLARAAAEALAEMPRLGWVTLQELSSSTNQVTAMAAREALARARGSA